jgi:hypothetical protein
MLALKIIEFTHFKTVEQQKAHRKWHEEIGAMKFSCSSIIRQQSTDAEMQFNF